MSRRIYTFYVDIFSHCNLRCPSCPVGNSGEELSTSKPSLMSKSLLEQILDKASGECEVGAVCLYNWTEPLLHPEVVELIGAIKQRKLVCWISSNLNILRRTDALVSSGLDFLRISLSGFTQSIYERGHRGGKIETVKANMRSLAAAIEETHSGTRVEVFYHVYRYNQHEIAPMKAFAEDLGFVFTTTFAYVTPVEKIIQIANGSFTPADMELLDSLAVPLDRAIEITSRTK